MKFSSRRAMSLFRGVSILLPTDCGKTAVRRPCPAGRKARVQQRMYRMTAEKALGNHESAPKEDADDAAIVLFCVRHVRGAPPER